MNQVVKDKWVDALESDRYEQGRNALCNLEGQMCCLGVLVDLYAQDHNLPWQEPMKVDGQGLEYKTFQCHWGSLPDAVQKWAELVDALPAVEFNGHTQTLSTLNDQEELSFKEIAILIKASL